MVRGDGGKRATSTANENFSVFARYRSVTAKVCQRFYRLIEAILE